MKTKKSPAKRKEKRQKTDWGLFFKLCRERKTNEEIATKMGWKAGPKLDPFKRVRAAKSLARTKGIRIDGKLVRLHDAKPRGIEKPKAAKTSRRKVGEPKPVLLQQSTQTPTKSQQSE